MNKRHTLLSGTLMAFLAVTFGAFGAHALKPVLVQSGYIETFELAVRYQFYHAFVLLISGTLMTHYTSPKLRYAALSFLMGIFFFCGSLYVLCFTRLDVLGAVTPIGGLLFLLGYIFLFAGIYQEKRHTPD